MAKLVGSALGARRQRLAYLHAPDEAALDEIDVLNHLVLDDPTGQISDNLMHVDHGSACRVRLDAERFDVGIEPAPPQSGLYLRTSSSDRAAIGSFCASQRRCVRTR